MHICTRTLFLRFLCLVLCCLALTACVTLGQSKGQVLADLQRKADAGDVEAQENLGTCYYLGKHVPQDYQKAKELWERAAAQGSTFAQFRLGDMYQNGIGVPRDYKKAAELYKTAADQGMAEAQYLLASCYCKGQGVPANRAKRDFWIKKACANGLKEACEDAKRLGIR